MTPDRQLAEWRRFEARAQTVMHERRRAAAQRRRELAELNAKGVWIGLDDLRAMVPNLRDSQQPEPLTASGGTGTLSGDVPTDC